MHTREFPEAVKVELVKSRDLSFTSGWLNDVVISLGRTNHFDSVERFLPFCFSAV